MRRHRINRTTGYLLAGLGFIIIMLMAAPATAGIAISLQNGLSFVLPASWHIRGGVGGALFYAQSGPEKPGLRMSVTNLPPINLGQEQIRHLTAGQMDEIKQSLDNLKGAGSLLKSELVKEKSGQYLFLRYGCEYLREDGPRAGLLLCFYNNKQNFMISFEYKTEKNYLPLIENIISSFAIEANQGVHGVSP